MRLEPDSTSLASSAQCSPGPHQSVKEMALAIHIDIQSLWQIAFQGNCSYMVVSSRDRVI